MRTRWDCIAVVALLLSQLGLAACEKKEGDRDEEQGETPAQEQKEHPQHALAAMDWKQLDQALGKAGAMQPGDAYKFGFPRSDLHVTVGGVAVKPTLALGSWVAFKQTGDSEAVAMGDLVVLESEVEAVVSKLEESGIQPTALHNHLLHESPHVLYMHIAGRGAPTKLGAGIHAALALTKTPLAAPSGPPPAPAPLGLDTAQIAQALGYHGKVNGGVYQIAVPRADTVRMESMEVPPSMGVATALNFQSTGNAKAAITGDFVLIASEVNPVIQALRTNGIEVTALHSHMLTESPRLFFMHFWANDDALKLARGLGAALAKMNVRKA
jgi:biotin operon repressor